MSTKITPISDIKTPHPLSYATCAPKSHPHHLSPAPAPAYHECLKNHAAAMGGHALDGCGEFMPSPSDPTSLKCAACGCHRNFHRRHPEDPAAVILPFRRLPPPPPRLSSLSPSPSPPRMALSAGTAVPETQVASPATPTAAKGEISSGRKRFRTKFSQDQKEKMFSFSRKMGWKMQRCDEGSVEKFCSEIGIGKGVLKVWMHNNKHTLGKRDVNSAASAAAIPSPTTNACVTVHFTGTTHNDTTAATTSNGPL